MDCIKCKRPLQPDWKVCPWCSSRQTPQKKRQTRRGNRQGTAYKRGKTWTAKVVVGWKNTENGPKPVPRTKGGFKTKTDALNYCSTLLNHPNRIASTITFEALYAQWEASYQERVTKSTMDCYRAAYKHCKPLWYLIFSELTGDELQACIDQCPAGKRTKENIKAFLSLLYKYAMHNSIVERNRAETLFTGNDKKGTREAFTMEELEKIRSSTLPYASYVLCLCYLGYRPGEMLKLKKSAYNPEKKCLVGGGKTKAGTDRIVTVSPKVLPIVEKRYAADSEYLFPRLQDGKQMSDNYFRKFAFDPLMDKLGITGRVPYSCRHTFANLLKNVSGSDTDKAALIGHADASMTKYYQSADYDSLRAITDKL